MKHLTRYRIGRRGDMPTNMTGIIVHDHWKSCLSLSNVKHAFCNAHHLRELQALIEHEKEDWAEQMAILLRRANHAVNFSRKHNKPIRQSLIERFERRYRQILKVGIDYHLSLPPLASKRTTPVKLKRNGGIKKTRGKRPLRIGHNLLLRLQRHQEAVMRFLHDPDTPFTNNEAEHDARPVKVREKISGCSRTEEGAEEFLTVKAVASTARKNGWGVLKTLKEGAQTIISKIRDLAQPKPDTLEPAT